MTYRYEKSLPGLGHIRKVTGLSDAGDIIEFQGLMQTLARSRPKLVQMFASGDLSATELLVANRQESLARLEPDPRALMRLWGERGMFASVFRRHKKNDGQTVRRYRVSALKLERMGALPALHEAQSKCGDTIRPETVRDLALIDWDAVAASWQGSPSDWMAFFRMLSHALTLHFGGKRTGRSHQVRTQIMDLLPRKAEHKRVPAISPAVFNRLVSLTPDYAQPCYQALLLTGFRVKTEYLRLEREHLRPQVFEVAVPGTKTAGSEAVIPIDPACWGMLDRAVPSPIRYGQIRKHWMRACLAEGLAVRADDPLRPGKTRYRGPTLHDIRHLTGQFATNAGVAESLVMVYLRHADAATTRRYTTQKVRSEVAGVMAQVLGVA